MTVFIYLFIFSKEFLDINLAKIYMIYPINYINGHTNVFEIEKNYNKNLDCKI